MVARIFSTGGVRRCVVLLAATASFACKSVEPCHPDSKGKTYRVTPIKLILQGLACPDDLGVGLGGSIEVKVTDFYDDSGSCTCGDGLLLSNFPGWEISKLSPRSECESSFFDSRFAAKNASCEGEIQLHIE